MSIKQNIPCIILEDSLLDLEMLREALESWPEFEILDSFTTPQEAREWFKSNQASLIFSDIEMPGESGLDFIRSLEDAPMVVFISSHGELAKEGFDLAALDFIEKPLTHDRFARCARKILEHFRMRQQSEQPWANFQHSEDEYLVIRDGNDYVRVNQKDIIYLEANGDFVNVHTDARKYMTLVNLKNFLLQIPEGLLTRCHKSYAVNHRKMVRLSGRSIHVSNQVIIPVGAEFADNITQRFVSGHLVKRKPE